jgi:prepilin signal peptidase PulO-like enzyme (type II secretory pathway)
VATVLNALWLVRQLEEFTEPEAAFAPAIGLAVCVALVFGRIVFSRPAAPPPSD